MLNKHIREMFGASKIHSPESFFNKFPNSKIYENPSTSFTTSASHKNGLLIMQVLWIKLTHFSCKKPCEA